MSVEAMKAIKMVYANTTKHDWPDDIWEAICEAIEAEKQEPVMGVEVKRIASGGFIGNVWWIHENLQEGVFHLYTRPPVPQGHEPKQEPLTNEQDEFEKVFQLPANCTRFKGGYAPTSYNAWDAQTFCSRWEGWKARAAHGIK